MEGASAIDICAKSGAVLHASNSDAIEVNLMIFAVPGRLFFKHKRAWRVASLGPRCLCSDLPATIVSTVNAKLLRILCQLTDVFRRIMLVRQERPKQQPGAKRKAR